MLTMVSISAEDGLNEGLSKSLSLRRKICELSSKLMCAKMRERPWVLACAKFSEEGTTLSRD